MEPVKAVHQRALPHSTPKATPCAHTRWHALQLACKSTTFRQSFFIYISCYSTAHGCCLRPVPDVCVATVTHKAERPSASIVMSQRQPSLLQLDHGVLRIVFNFLEPAALARSACVCRAFREVATDEAYWEKHCTHRWTHPNKHLKHVFRGANC